MKKFALALLVAFVGLFGFAGAASAQYPPGADAPTVDDSTPAPGGPVNVTVNCQPGETVTVTLGSSTGTAVCGASGTATVQVNAPSGAGTTTGQATGSNTGSLGQFTVVVEATTDPGGGLPATGSDGTSTTVWIAASLLVVGLGLFGVAAVRRRDNAVA